MTFRRLNVGANGTDIIMPHPSAPDSKVGYVVARVVYSTDVETQTPTEETLQYAKLFAAAPEMFEALQECEKIVNEFHALKPTVRKNFHGLNVVACAFKQIRLAIAKAEGKEL